MSILPTANVTSRADLIMICCTSTIAATIAIDNHVSADYIYLLSICLSFHILLLYYCINTCYTILKINILKRAFFYAFVHSADSVTFFNYSAPNSGVTQLLLR